jgi:ADP-heptose:LPS heptosyltransferase
VAVPISQHLPHYAHAPRFSSVSTPAFLHLAATMKTPVVGIYGPTSWKLTGPRGVEHRIVRHPVECSPCFLSQCRWQGEEHRKCLTGLLPDQVVRAARDIIGL